MEVQEILNILECVVEESVYEPPVIDTTPWYRSNPLYSKKVYSDGSIISSATSETPIDDTEIHIYTNQL